MIFHSFDIDIDPMTVVLKINLDNVKMYLHANTKF